MAARAETVLGNLGVGNQSGEREGVRVSTEGGRASRDQQFSGPLASGWPKGQRGGIALPLAQLGL